MARLPLERVEPTIDHLLQDVGLRCSALSPPETAYLERSKWGDPWDMKAFRHTLRRRTIFRSSTI